jgi:hypothetical protein
MHTSAGGKSVLSTKKVFCNDCVWIDGIWDCRLREGYRSTARTRREAIISIRDPEEQNRDNNCRDYKRKWWKIWR